MDAVLANILATRSSHLTNELSNNGGTWCVSIIEKLKSYSSSGTLPWNAVSVDANSLLKFAWEKLHLGYWKDVAMIWRELYSFAAICYAVANAVEGKANDAVRALDMGILMGSPTYLVEIQQLIHLITSTEEFKLSRSKRKREAASTGHTKKQATEDAVILMQVDPKHQIPILESPPSLTTFFREYMVKQRPVIIRGFVSQWPAVAEPSRKWSGLDYLRAVAGFRLVPVEVGSKYTEREWSQTLMPLEEFIDTFISKLQAPSKVEWIDQPGYVAQTTLFDQIPQLAKDIVVPDYTVLKHPSHLGGDSDDHQDESVKINAWFGPAGTVSPIHHDPYDNLFCQVVGSKYVRLYDSCLQQEMYPYSREESVLDNTSQVDLDTYLTSKDETALQPFPLFRSAGYQEAVVQEGDMLYIPPRWWHFVKSLSTSFSVSFWWGSS
eukprot:TRINITY_DN14016_c0_g1_i1.p1 TRINITY_DN14016_c0_g1~~TRINITY_DN14016_c0_g1_i1.p1  ORF type:complete len:437 (+),score=48.43 TRINITY_DN14016_c0_g1_i1:260-1570(+)